MMNHFIAEQFLLLVIVSSNMIFDEISASDQNTGKIMIAVNIVFIVIKIYFTT
jgi:hypothetical protein